MLFIFSLYCLYPSVIYTMADSATDSETEAVSAEPNPPPPNQKNDDIEATPVPENVDGTTVIEVPLWWPNEAMIPEDHVSQKELILSLKKEHPNPEDWLTEKLVSELQSFFPRQEDILDDVDRARSAQAFEERVAPFFSIGRCFLCPEQFISACRYLLDAWAVKAIHFGKSAACAYSKPKYKTKAELARTGDAPQPKRNRTSYKSDCPFEVRYNYINKKKFATLFGPIRITKVNLRHTCPLSSGSHRLAYVCTDKTSRSCNLMQ
jgi:hypothetical protein